MGGVSRISTLRKTLAAARSRSVFLDAGDFSEGSWYYNIDTGANMMRIMSAMGYDAVVLGNHDYLAGPARIAETIDEAAPAFSILATNLDFATYQDEPGFRERVLPSTVIVKDGIRIGVVGLTTMDYSFATYLAPLVATDPVEAAQTEVARIKDSVDVVILLSHNSFSTNLQLARAVLGVHAVVSGHSHVKFASAQLVENAGRQVPVVETGKWGAFLGELVLKVNAKDKVVTFGSYELHPVSALSENDAAVDAMVAEEDQRLAAMYGGDPFEVIAEAEDDLTHRDIHHASTVDLATKAYRSAAVADLSLESSPLVGITYPKGPVTVFGLHDIIPHVYVRETGREWTVKVWNARGDDIGLMVNILYSGANLFPTVGQELVAFDNLIVHWTPGNEENPIPVVEDIFIGGERLDITKRYRVALTDGMWLAFNIINDLVPLGMDLSQLEETGIEGWRAVLDYARQNPVLSAKSLRDGTGAFTTVADPALAPYQFRRVGNQLEVVVTNEGLEDVASVAVECSYGVLNDFVRYETDEEIFEALPVQNVPDPIAVGSSALVTLGPIPSGVGYRNFRCTVLSGVDGYPGNSEARQVLWIDYLGPGRNFPFRDWA
ncbi:MAG: metallophosphoesterase, partial [Bdellovibrionota bacterium]